MEMRGGGGDDGEVKVARQKPKPKPAGTLKMEWVDEVIAREWLGLNVPDQRRLSAAHFSSLARAMKEDRFLYNAQTVVFDENGKLINGQHRLLAIIESGEGQWLAVARGVLHAAFPTMDQGQTRKAAQWADERWGNFGMSALRLVYALQKLADTDEEFDGLPLYGYRRASNDELVKLWNDMPDFIQSGDFIVEQCKGLCKDVMTTSTAIFAHWYCARVDQGLADAFFSQLGDGQNLRAGDPIYTLRERLLSKQIYKGMENKADQRRRLAIALTVKAWNAVRTQKPMKKGGLRWSPSQERFPEPI